MLLLSFKDKGLSLVVSVETHQEGKTNPCLPEDVVDSIVSPLKKHQTSVTLQIHIFVLAMCVQK